MPLIHLPDPSAPLPSEITPPEVYRDRRRFMQAGLALATLPWFAESAQAGLAAQKSSLSTDEPLNKLSDITRYNNFYEFGVDKADPAVNAGSLRTSPWTVRVEGAVQSPRTFDLDALMKLAPMEERVYRLRCVEGWSMVIPWIGFPLAALLKQVQPTAAGKFVEFVTLHDPKQMPGQRQPVLEWPYREGLRIDEAMHPLTLLTFGLYGEVLPRQNGAPVRLVVPWKYGFKSIKSIVAIRLVEKAPLTSWMQANPREYGFFSNVNPEVDHPRWSQASERRIGEFLKRKTLMFNGYAEQVAGLYRGMDLRKFF